MCLLIFRRAFEDETTAFQVPVSLPGDMLSKRLQPQHKAGLDICINPSASPRQRWLLGRHPPLNLEKKKTSQEWWKNTANVVKLLHCYAAVRWLHWQVSDERFSGTSKNSHGFCYCLEFYNMTCKCAWDCLRMWECCLTEEAVHMNSSVQDSRVNAVDKAIGFTWQSIVLISPVSLSI